MSRFISSLCLLITLNCYGQENLPEQDQDDGTVKGEGWVIELETSSVIYEGTEESKSPTADNENGEVNGERGGGIEFIIGGEGKDGIAKKGKLRVDD